MKRVRVIIQIIKSAVKNNFKSVKVEKKSWNINYEYKIKQRVFIIILIQH